MKNRGAAIFSLTQRGGNAPVAQHRHESFPAVGGKNTGTLSQSESGRVPVQINGNTSALPPLTGSQLVRETQDIVLRFPIKEMAEYQGATTRAVESQRNGDSAISFRAAVNMCRANPRARAMVARLIGIPGQCSDPDFMEGLEKVVDYYMRQQRQDPAAGIDVDHQGEDLFGAIQ